MGAQNKDSIQAFVDFPIDILVQHGMGAHAISFLREHEKIDLVNGLRNIDPKRVGEFPIECEEKKVLRNLIEETTKEAALKNTQDCPQKNTFIHFPEREVSVEEFADMHILAQSCPPCMFYQTQEPIAPPTPSNDVEKDVEKDVENVESSMLLSHVSQAPNIFSTITEVGEPGVCVAVSTFDPACPTPGSKDHFCGGCTPCAWHHCGEGCRHGAACIFCHLCPPGEMKRRKKEKKKMFRDSFRDNFRWGGYRNSRPNHHAQTKWSNSHQALDTQPERTSLPQALAPAMPSAYPNAAGYDVDVPQQRRRSGFLKNASAMVKRGSDMIRGRLSR